MSKINELAVAPKVGDHVRWTSHGKQYRGRIHVIITDNPERPNHYIGVRVGGDKRKDVKWPMVSELDFLQLELPLGIQSV